MTTEVLKLRKKIVNILGISHSDFKEIFKFKNLKNVSETSLKDMERLSDALDFTLVHFNGDMDKVNLWLNIDHPRLHYCSPLYYMMVGGLHVVLNLLEEARKNQEGKDE